MFYVYNMQTGGGDLSNCNILNKKRKGFTNGRAFSSGFTLIELLAVIVILSLTALIAIPMILNVIESSRKGAYEESLRNLIKAVEYYEINEEMNGNMVDFKEGIDVSNPNIEMKNKQFTSGMIKKDDAGKFYLELVSNDSYCGNGYIDKLNIIKGSCDQLDVTVPSDITIIENKVTSSSITVSATVTVGHSGVKYYEYSMDGGKTYTKIEENSYTFMNLTKDTEYQIKVRVTAGNNSMGESEVKTIKTRNIETPTYAITPNTVEWVQKRNVTITYPEREEGYIYDYSLDKGKTWIELKEGNEKELEFTENGIIIARISDGTNIVSGETFVVSHVDSENPIINSVTGNNETWVQSVTLSIDAEDGISGLHESAYSFDDGVTWQEENTKVFTSNGSIKIKVRDKALNEVSTNIEITKVDSGVPTAPTITGGSDTWTNGNRMISVSKESTSLSGIAKYQYYISTSNTGQVGGAWTDIANAGKSVSISTEGTRYIYFRAVNNAGRIGSVSNVQGTKIDKTLPSITNIVVDTHWTTTNKSINITSKEEGSGIAGYYIGTNNTKPTLSSSWNASTSNSYQYSKGMGTYYVWVKDVAGNISSSASQVNVTKITGTNIRDYVQSGLQVFYDGLMATGSGPNSNTSSTKGIWKDLSGNGRDGTLVDFSYSGESGWVNNGLSFGDKPDFVRIAEMKYENVTIESVTKLGTLSSNQNHFLVSNIENGGYGLIAFVSEDGVYKAGTFYIRTTPNNHWFYEQSPINQSFYVSGRHNSTMSACNINEKKYIYNQVGGAVKHPVSGINMVLGGNASPTGIGATEYFHGIINVVRIYNRVLTDDEIEKNYVIDKARYGF